MYLSPLPGAEIGVGRAALSKPGVTLGSTQLKTLCCPKLPCDVLTKLLLIHFMLGKQKGKATLASVCAKPKSDLLILTVFVALLK